MRERLALEARGGEARGYDPHRAAAEPARPAVQVRRGGGRRGRHAERQPMDYPRAAAGGRRGRGVRRRRADRHRGVGTVPARLDPRAELSTDTDTLARGTRVHDRTIAIRFSVSPTIPPLTPPNILFTIFYYLPSKNSSPYNSFSPTILPYLFPLYTITH